MAKEYLIISQLRFDLGGGWMDQLMNEDQGLIENLVDKWENVNPSITL